MNANYHLAGITQNHMGNQQGNYGKVLPVFAEE